MSWPVKILPFSHTVPAPTSERRTERGGWRAVAPCSRPQQTTAVPQQQPTAQQRRCVIVMHFVITLLVTRDTWTEQQPGNYYEWICGRRVITLNGYVRDGWLHWIDMWETGDYWKQYLVLDYCEGYLTRYFGRRPILSLRSELRRRWQRWPGDLAALHITE